MEKEEKTKWMVCVHCATYNHAPYIKDTLDGFCKQVTNFPFVCVIVDDASTDKEHEVICNYMKEYFEQTENTKEMEETEDFMMSFAQHKVNKNCFFAFHQLKYNHGSIKKSRAPYYIKWDNNAKYIARCEGDDYWSSAEKLQKQVDILEQGPQYTLVHTAFEFINDKGEKIEAPEAIYRKIPFRKKEGHIWQDHLVIGTPIMLCTTMTRKGLIDEGQPNVDYNQFMSCSRKGQIAYIGDKMASYRILSTSMMRTQRNRVNLLIKNGIFWQLYFFSRRQYETDNYYKRNLRARVLVSEAIISSLLIWNKLTVPEKNKKLLYILFLRPLNLLLLPMALVTKIARRLLGD